MRRLFAIAACAPPNATRLETASTGALSPHSHSIVNEPSKLLIRKALDAAPQTFAVIPAVNLSGTSIGAGFRAIRRRVTFRDLSTSIDSRGDSIRHRHAPAPVTEAPKKGRHQTAWAIVPTQLFAQLLAVTTPYPRCSRRPRSESIASHRSQRTIWRGRIALRSRDWRAAALPAPPCPAHNSDSSAKQAHAPSQAAARIRNSVAFTTGLTRVFSR